MLARGLMLPSAVVATLALGPSSVSARPELVPMIFFVAKGEPNACGPGCSEWIAAEGDFDGPAVEQRFRQLLGSLKGRDLPIFFNSFGGIVGEARVLGRILREHRMTASVGESLPEACGGRTPADTSCRQIIQSNSDVKAKLRTSGAMCHSACVYALIGASRRQVPADARLGIHASAATPESLRPGAPTAQQLESERKRYVLEMGVSPGLVDLSMKTASDSLHILSRDEIAQFGIETRAAYETDWMPYEERSSKRQFMLKAITQPSGSDDSEYRTTNLRMTCSQTKPGTAVAYQRELASNEIGVPARFFMQVGNQRFGLDHGPLREGIQQLAVIADRDLASKVVAAGRIMFIERFFPQKGSSWSRELKVSAAGLEQALHPSLKDCGAR